jgi:hypothetical protein
MGLVVVDVESTVEHSVDAWRLSVAPMMDWTLCSAFMRAAAVLVANL